MLKRNPYILFFIYLLFSECAKAQPGKDVVVDTVTVMMQPPVADRSGQGNFDTIGLLKEVAVRSVPKGVVDSLKAADDFWYADLERARKKTPAQPEQPRNKTLFQQKWFRDLLWIIILSSFIGVVIWYLVASNIFIFRKRSKKIISDEGAPETTDDIFSHHYDAEIVSATEAGNYRLAVRLWYLRTLKELANRGLIDYRSGRTNQDYVSHLAKSPFYSDFFRLTRNFEYTWYGQFNLSTAAYDMMRNDFENFQNRLR
jgi:hypothetical protein